MVGTVFLWMYWPSFNAALVIGAGQQRAVINTLLSICGSCITACSISRLALQRIDMEVLLNATLAGGVAIGASADLIVSGGVAIVVGFFAGILSACGFLWLGPFLKKKIHLHDTCGVHSLHGMPGVFGGIVGAISASLADSQYSNPEALANSFPEIKNGRTAAD